MLRKMVVLLSIVCLLLCCSQSYAWSLLGMGGSGSAVIEAGGGSSRASSQEVGNSVSGFSFWGGGEKKESFNIFNWVKDVFGTFTEKSDKSGTDGFGFFGMAEKQDTGNLWDSIISFFSKMMPGGTLKVEQRADLTGSGYGLLWMNSDHLSTNPIDVIKGTSLVKVTTLNNVDTNGVSIHKGSVFYVESNHISTIPDDGLFFGFGTEISKDPEAVEIQLSDGTTGRWAYCADLKTEEDVKERIQ